MKVDYRDIEDIEDYEMVPIESMMQGFSQMNNRPIMGMNPDMGMDPYMGMEPWMGMGQFNNEGMFMNGSDPMGMPYADMSAYEDDGLSEQDMNGDRKPYDSGYNKFNPKYNDVDSIVRKIERYNPGIFRMLTRCGIPYARVVGLVKRIVRLTLMYRDEKRML
ncbi:MAG: hypothetical protein MUO60_17070 [Clostridiaceae bacterium]|nr:hypothetical protein [Clostridiaceae bacterium]